jgi:hypothetical protein
MRFPYQAFPVRDAGSVRYTLIRRPMIKIRVIGPAGADELMGLADTGSDDTLLPDLLIGPLGVAIRPGDQALVVDINGGRSLVRYGTVDLEIPAPGGAYRWSARVGFHAGFNTTLGHVGFFDHFTATFNGRSRHITLTPNGTAPAPTMPIP